MLDISTPCTECLIDDAASLMSGICEIDWESTSGWELSQLCWRSWIRQKSKFFYNWETFFLLKVVQELSILLVVPKNESFFPLASTPFLLRFEFTRQGVGFHKLMMQYKPRNYGGSKGGGGGQTEKCNLQPKLNTSRPIVYFLSCFYLWGQHQQAYWEGGCGCSC